MAEPGKPIWRVRSADSFLRSRSMPPWIMPNREGVEKVCGGTAALGCKGEHKLACWAAELRSAGRLKTAVPTCSRLPHGPSCLCSSKYFLLRAAQRAVISIDARARARSTRSEEHTSELQSL